MKVILSQTITPVTVVNVTDGSLQSNYTVLVKNDRIVAVGPVDEVEVPGSTSGPSSLTDDYTAEQTLTG